MLLALTCCLCCKASVLAALQSQDPDLCGAFSMPAEFGYLTQDFLTNLVIQSNWLTPV